jgi:hypothetical protein
MELASTLHKLFQAAKAFEKRAPQYQRIEQEREALRDALVEAGLVLSTLSESRRNGEAESRQKDKMESSRNGTTKSPASGKRSRGGQKKTQPTISPKERA